MRPGAGKNKGSSFERAVGAKLSLWLSSGKRKDLLCRTVGSGAQFTFSKASSGNPGDLMAQRIEGYEFCSNYVIEAKHWKKLNFLQFLSRKGDLYKAMEKVQKESTGVNKKWFLICRQNYHDDILLTSKIDITPALFDGCAMPFYHQLFSGGVLMFLLDEFLKAVNPGKYILL